MAIQTCIFTRYCQVFHRRDGREDDGEGRVPKLQAMAFRIKWKSNGDGDGSNARYQIDMEKKMERMMTRKKVQIYRECCGEVDDKEEGANLQGMASRKRIQKCFPKKST